MSPGPCGYAPRRFELRLQSVSAPMQIAKSFDSYGIILDPFRLSGVRKEQIQVLAPAALEITCGYRRGSVVVLAFDAELVDVPAAALSASGPGAPATVVPVDETALLAKRTLRAPIR